MRIVGGYQNTKPSGEDLPITPFLFLVNMRIRDIKVKGIGLQWFYLAIYIGISFNLPKSIKSFNNHKIEKL